MTGQHEVATFVAEHDLRCEPAFRALDLASEVGEVASNVTKSTDYGYSPADLSVEPDEIGDVLFSVLALADSLDIDAEEALSRSIEKYRARLSETGSASSEG